MPTLRTHEPPVLTPSRLRDFNRAQESIDVALEQVARFEDAADDRAHFDAIDAMTPEEMRAACGLSDDEIARGAAMMRAIVGSYGLCIGCGEEALVCGYDAPHDGDFALVHASTCASCFFTHGESAVAGEG